MAVSATWATSAAASTTPPSCPPPPGGGRRTYGQAGALPPPPAGATAPDPRATDGLLTPLPPPAGAAPEAPLSPLQHSALPVADVLAQLDSAQKGNATVE